MTKTKWDRNFGFFDAAQQAAPQGSTGLTQNLNMFGLDIRLPANVVYSSDPWSLLW